MTAAPTTGAPVPSTTFPLRARFCAKALPEHSTSIATTITEAATFKKCLNIGLIGKKIKKELLPFFTKLPFDQKRR
jgi:hypothetical protein